MATQKSYTTVNVVRFGYSLLSVTFDRVNTDNVKQVVCNLISTITVADNSDQDHISINWDKSIESVNKFASFNIEGTGNYTDDYRVSIQHFDITEGQRRDAIHACPDVSPMFL